MWENDLLPASSKLDTYFKETKRYVMSRRYQGVPKINIIKKTHRLGVFLFYKIGGKRMGSYVADLNESMSVYSTIKRKK